MSKHAATVNIGLESCSTTISALLDFVPTAITELESGIATISALPDFVTTVITRLESGSTTICALPDFGQMLFQKSSYCYALCVKPAYLDFS